MDLGYSLGERLERVGVVLDVQTNDATGRADGGIEPSKESDMLQDASYTSIEGLYSLRGKEDKDEDAGEDEDDRDEDRDEDRDDRDHRGRRDHDEDDRDEDEDDRNEDEDDKDEDDDDDDDDDD